MTRPAKFSVAAAAITQPYSTNMRQEMSLTPEEITERNAKCTRYFLDLNRLRDGEKIVVAYIGEDGQRVEIEPVTVEEFEKGGPPVSVPFEIYKKEESKVATKKPVTDYGLKEDGKAETFDPDRINDERKVPGGDLTPEEESKVLEEFDPPETALEKEPETASVAAKETFAVVLPAQEKPEVLSSWGAVEKFIAENVPPAKMGTIEVWRKVEVEYSFQIRKGA